MPKKKAQPAVEAVQPAVVGHVIKPRYREFECDWIDLDEGEVPFRATIRVNLSFAEVNALPPLNGSLYVDIWEILAPHVTAWNLEAVDHLTGERKPVPPPAEVGVSAFQATDPMYTHWMYMTLKTAHQGGVNGALEAKNVSGPSESGPPPEKSSDSATT